ncbi:MAG TPA: hypothetical protein VIC05_08315 [Solirubrobacteraceae bacterium]|jgi:hypothetical protein
MQLGVLAPFALAGEAVTGSQTAFALLAVGSIIGGWVLLAGLWYFVFRDRGDKTSEQPVGEHQTGGDGKHVTAAASSPTNDGVEL